MEENLVPDLVVSKGDQVFTVEGLGTFNLLIAEREEACEVIGSGEGSRRGGGEGGRERG